MQNYHDYALRILKENSYKITKPREILLRFFAENEKVLTVPEMQSLLKKKKIYTDKVTIYRIIETFESLGLIHKVMALNGYIRCHARKLIQSKCHHYLLCRNCRKAEEVEGENLYNLEKKIIQQNKFKVELHYLEFIGLCKQCLDRISL